MDLGKISHIFQHLSPLKIDSSRCIKTISPMAHCEKCSQICPQQTLFFDGEQWHSDNCVACGLCVMACPNGVFQLEESHLLQQAKENKRLIITCFEQNNLPEEIIKINCLQQLYPELVLTLMSQVDQLVIYAEKGHCDQCHHWFPLSLQAQLAQFHLPLIEKLLIIEDKYQLDQYLSQIQQSEHPHTTRRSFLKNLMGQAKTTPTHLLAATADRFLEFDEPVKQLTIPHLASRRQKLLPIYRHLESHIDVADTIPYRSLAIDFCTFCGACQRLCPTQSLSISENDLGEKMLSFSAQHCNQCNLCIDICFHKKIYWSDYVTIEQFLSDQPTILAQGERRVCTQCEQDFWQFGKDSDVCHLCK